MTIINLFGGPGSGKSTIASYLFSHFKTLGKYKVELITEYAKDCVYEKRNELLKIDQLYVFAKQNHKIKMIENYANDIDILITDSPLLLSSIYGELNNSVTELFKGLVNETFNSYKNLNFMITRNLNLFNYEDYGRLQTNEEAINIDNKIENYLRKNDIKYEKLVNNVDLKNVLIQLIHSEQFNEFYKEKFGENI